MYKIRTKPPNKPIRKDKKIIIAREASNLQKKRLIITRIAFWTENIATNINNIMNQTCPK